MAKVTLNELSKRYQSSSGADVAAVTKVTLAIEDRELLVLFGRKGAGKSTVLRLISGLENASAGDVSIGDRRVNDIVPHQRDIALVTSDDVLYPAMTVRENLAIGLQSQRFKDAEIKRRIGDAASVLAIEPLLDRQPAMLSLSERQKIAIARALARQPKAILLDEPFARLDTEARLQLRAEIAKLHQRRDTTIIYATSDSADAMMLADRVAVLNEGAVQQVDTPEAIYDAPANLAVASFFGTPPMNLIHGTLKQDREAIRFIEIGDGSIELTLTGAAESVRALAGQQVVLGVRAEDILLARAPKAQSGSGATFPAVAELVEPTGAGTLIHVQTGAHAIVCRTGGAIPRADAGRRMRFELDQTRLRFFDPANGQRLASA